MGRLYEAKVKDDRWEVEELKSEGYPSYILKDTKECYSYTLNGIIGFEQVADNEFLVYRRSGGDDFSIIRYRFDKSDKKMIYNERVYDFKFLSDDHILFMYNTNSASKHIKGVYSISQNANVKEAEWLRMAEVHSNEENKLLLSMSALCYGDVIFTVNTDTFEPEGLCYSTLRDSYINISSKEELEKVIEEDKGYGSFISDYNFSLENEAKKKAKEKILKKELSK